MNRDQLKITQKLSYGVGHVLNDLTGSMWFSYLLVYLHQIIGFENSLAGYMMLLGQIADGLSTAFIGIESDKTKSGLFNYGRRKSWHLVGVISVLISFPFMFNLCITCDKSPEWARFYYYAPFVFIFQFGWAACQINHLALIPQLTTSENEKVALNSIRYAFTVMSNIFVYGVAFLLLKFNRTDGTKDDSNLNINDAPKFMYLTIIVCGVGLLFQIIFHIGTNEKNLRNDEEFKNQTYENSSNADLDWFGYLKTPGFYILGVLYMCTRLIVNMTQVYLPMYITDTLKLDKSSIALIPLICFISGFISTFPIRYLSKYFGTHFVYFIGIILILISSSLFWFKHLIYSYTINTIISSIFLGSGSSVILVCSLCLTTSLIGKNTGSSAFVYGSMSFIDKFSNGIVVALLQQFSPCQYHSSDCSCKRYYHFIMAFLPSSCCLIAFISVVSLFLMRPRNQETTLLVNREENENNQTYGSIEQENQPIVI